MSKDAKREKNRRRRMNAKAKRGTKTQKVDRLTLNSRQQAALGIAVLGLVQKMKGGRR